MAKRSNESECWKIFNMRDDLDDVAAVPASDDVALQHRWPAVRLCILSHVWSFVKV